MAANKLCQGQVSALGAKVLAEFKTNWRELTASPFVHRSDIGLSLSPRLRLTQNL